MPGRHLAVTSRVAARGTVGAMALTSERARLSAVLVRPRPGQVVWCVVGAVVAVAALTAATVAAHSQPGDPGNAASEGSPDAAGAVAAVSLAA